MNNSTGPIQFLEMKNTTTYKMKIVFATNNENKIREIKALVPKSIKILSLSDIRCFEEIKETGKTISENALIKSNYIKNNYGYDCFSDDTGLEVSCLGGEPGVFSARYSGTPVDSKRNIDLILKKMELQIDRSAQFRTCISLIINKKKKLFEGIVKGEITSFPMGEMGFGYDPIFKSLGSKKTFAELSLNEKNNLSHRGIALKKLIKYLLKLNI